jgi:hypothetical protein
MGSALQRQSPGAQRIQRLAAPLSDEGGPQYRACAAREEHAQVTIATFGDSPQATFLA